jgi:hypothetical protein
LHVSQRSADTPHSAITETTAPAQAGCSANEIAAWSGQSLREVERYTKAADQKRLALNALIRTATAQTKQGAA